MSNMEEQTDLNDFWGPIEKTNNVCVPEYVKKLLHVCGYDNKISFMSLNSEDIDVMEKFAQIELPSLIPDKSELSQYYGLYSSNISNFKLLPGHRKMLLTLAEVLKFPRRPGKDIFPVRKPSTQNCQQIRDLVSQHGETSTSTSYTVADDIGLFDITHYKSSLVKSLSAWTLQNLMYFNRNCDSAMQPCDVFEVATIHSEAVGTAEDRAYTAEVLCMLCLNQGSDKTLITVRTQRNRWTSSNFYRHLQRYHFLKGHTLGSRRSNPKNSSSNSETGKQQRIVDMMQQVTSKVSKDIDEKDSAKGPPDDVILDHEDISEDITTGVNSQQSKKRPMRISSSDEEAETVPGNKDIARDIRVKTAEQNDIQIEADVDKKKGVNII